MLKEEEQDLSVITMASGFVYSTLIILMNEEPKPTDSNTVHRYYNSKWSNAFIDLYRSVWSLRAEVIVQAS